MIRRTFFLGVLAVWALLPACSDNPSAPPAEPAGGFVPATRLSWFYSSMPASSLPLAAGSSPVALDPTSRGQLLWFTKDAVVSPDMSPDPVPVLHVVFIPREAATGPSWGGLATALSSDQTAMIVADRLEIWINDYVNFSRSEARRGELYVDVGRVSEDAVWDPVTPPSPPNLLLDFEDRNRSGGTVEVAEDTGLDGVRDEDEPPAEGARMTSYSPEADPAGDDRVPSFDLNLPEDSATDRILKFRGINGTEGNNRADSEDLDGDFHLDTDNDYWEYGIDLSGPACVDLGRDTGVTDPKNGWRMYRLDLGQYHLKVGDPGLDDIENLRIWFQGVAAGDTLDVQIASFPDPWPKSCP